MSLMVGTSLMSASASAATSRSTPGFPVTVRAANGSVLIGARPHAIVSLSPTATEDLFAIGAGAQVKAVDNESDYPANAPKTSLSGFSPNLEAIAHVHPDLVVISEDANGLVAGLTKLHVPVLVEPAASNLDQAYGEMTSLGEATGHVARARALVTTTKSSLAATIAAAPHLSSMPSYYYELDQTYYSLTSSTFIGRLFALFHARDIADNAKGASDGYPQLSAEYVIAAQPSMIFLADTLCCKQSAATVAARPGWSAIAAVKKGDVIALNDDIASRWGPRITVLASAIEKALWAYSKQH